MLEGNTSKINEMWYINMQTEHLKNNTPLKTIANRVYEIRKKETNNYFYQEMWSPVPVACIKSNKAGFLPHDQY